jgi:hypothetical protein
MSMIDRRFTLYPVSTSVSVSVSTGCTPGVIAMNCMRTDWHVVGRSGLCPSSVPRTAYSLAQTAHPIRTRFSSATMPGASSFPKWVSAAGGK